MYGNGMGVDQDLGRARALFQAACEAGNAPACSDLATIVSMQGPQGGSADGTTAGVHPGNVDVKNVF